jgi:hypothetical protein
MINLPRHEARQWLELFRLWGPAFQADPDNMNRCARKLGASGTDGAEGRTGRRARLDHARRHPRQTALHTSHSATNL